MGYYWKDEEPEAGKPPYICPGCTKKVLKAAAIKWYGDHPDQSPALEIVIDFKSNSVTVRPDEPISETTTYAFSEIGINDVC